MTKLIFIINKLLKIQSKQWIIYKAFSQLETYARFTLKWSSLIGDRRSPPVHKYGLKLSSNVGGNRVAWQSSSESETSNTWSSPQPSRNQTQGWNL